MSTIGNLFFTWISRIFGHESYEERFGTDEELLASDWETIKNDFPVLCDD